MKKFILQLIDNDINEYGILKDFIKDYLYNEKNDFSCIYDLYSTISNSIMENNSSNKIRLLKDQDLYLGKIIFVYNKLLEIRIMARKQNIESNEFNEYVEKYKKIYVFTKEILIFSCWDLFKSIVKEFENKGAEREDLIQEGKIKLFTGMDIYDYRKNVKFTTYATFWIKSGMREALNKARAIRLPVHVVAEISRVNIVKNKLENSLKREPTSEEIAVASEIPLNKVEKYKKYLQSVISFQAESKNNDEESSTFENILPSEENVEDEVCTILLYENLKQIVLDLPNKKESQVIVLRYGLDGKNPRTLDEIGQIMGITKERVRQIESKALRNLRHPSNSKKIKEYF